jgi:cobalt/nickel transport protein
MKTIRRLTLVTLTLFLLLYAIPSFAHFGMIIPSKSTVMETADNNVTLEVKFWHPFENAGLNLTLPKSFKVISAGKDTNLLSSLKEVKVITYLLIVWTIR